MKNVFTLENIFTLEKVIFAVVIIAILAAIAFSIGLKRIKNSRNEAAQMLLQRIALAEMGMMSECFNCLPEYAFTDGLDETAEAAIVRLARNNSHHRPGAQPKYDFIPDGSVAFHIMRPGTFNGEAMIGFVAFAAHNSVGSTVYVYDNIDAKGVEEALENSYHDGITVTSAVPTLFRYKYEASTKTAVKFPNQTRFGSNPKDEYPARLVVTIAAE